MKIYTKTGDAGKTSLVGGERVSKADARLDAYGTADELNSHIGLLMSLPGVDKGLLDTLGAVQCRIFELGGELATPADAKRRPKGLDPAAVAYLEGQIDDLDAALPPLRSFVLPQGTTASAQAQVARTVCRRTERCMVRMVEAGLPVSETAMRYINRLSDYLFVAARKINHDAGIADIPYIP